MAIIFGGILRIPEFWTLRFRSRLKRDISFLEIHATCLDSGTSVPNCFPYIRIAIDHIILLIYHKTCVVLSIHIIIFIYMIIPSMIIDFCLLMPFQFPYSNVFFHLYINVFILREKLFCSQFSLAFSLYTCAHVLTTCQRRHIASIGPVIHTKYMSKRSMIFRDICRVSGVFSRVYNLQTVHPKCVSLRVV